MKQCFGGDRVTQVAFFLTHTVTVTSTYCSEKNTPTPGLYQKQETRVHKISRAFCALSIHVLKNPESNWQFSVKNALGPITGLIFRSCRIGRVDGSLLHEGLIAGKLHVLFKRRNTSLFIRADVVTRGEQTRRLLYFW